MPVWTPYFDVKIATEQLSEVSHLFEKVAKSDPKEDSAAINDLNEKLDNLNTILSSPSNPMITKPA